jgi:radical SAM/Cys-rich protein
MEPAREMEFQKTKRGRENVCVPDNSFSHMLKKHQLTLERADITTFQVNVGLVCNQACKHCHLEAGPHREELMDMETLDQVVAFAEKHRFETIDITGGATELHPYLTDLVDTLAPLSDRVMVRTNLSALQEGDPDRLINAFLRNGVVLVASFPSFNPSQLESQRGKGIFDKSIAALKRLNEAGYGVTADSPELDLVSNPAGAFLPPAQLQAEKRFRTYLEKKWGIFFSHLYTFANVPLGRFRQWLQTTGNLENYLARLRSAFNPCVVKGLMCRTLLSVAWDGFLYDCDFNQAAGLAMGGRRRHISQIEVPPAKGTPIAVADHCFTCTAGSGFT